MKCSISSSNHLDLPSTPLRRIGWTASWILGWVLGWIAVWILGAAPASANEHAIQLAMNPPPHLDKMTVNQARSIFSMRLRAWPDGSPITVFVMQDNNPDHKLFVRSILALLPHQLRRQWDRLVYTGIGQAPIEVKDAEEMLQRLIGTPGSIGYIKTGHDNEQLRIIPLQ